MTPCRFTIAVLAAWAAVAVPQSAVAQGSFNSGNFFERLDLNADGLLTSADMSNQRQELFSRLLQLGDKDNDGKLTKQEFVTSLRNRSLDQLQPPNRSRGGRGQSGSRGQSGGPRGGSFGVSTPDVGDSLPDLTVYDAKGKEFSLSGLKGSYLVLVFGCLT